MGHKCFIEGCSSSSYTNITNISFHRIKVCNPVVYQNRITSIAVLNNQQNIYNHPKFAVICSNHFIPNSFVPGLSQRKLKENAVPSIFPRCNKMDNMECLLFDNSVQESSVPENTDPLDVVQDIQSTSAIHPVINEERVSYADVITPPRLKRVCYAGDVPDDIEDSTAPILKKYVNVLKKKVVTLNQDNLRLKKKCMRQTIKIKKFKDLLLALRKKKIISKRGTNVLEVCYKLL